MVLVGAEGVVENGGVINKLGTYQAAVSAYCHNTPFYVAAESYKVSRAPQPVKQGTRYLQAQMSGQKLPHMPRQA